MHPSTSPDKMPGSSDDWKSYKREWSRRRRAELRQQGLSAHGHPYVIPQDDPRRQVRVQPETAS